MIRFKRYSKDSKFIEESLTSKQVNRFANATLTPTKVSASSDNTAQPKISKPKERKKNPNEVSKSFSFAKRFKDWKAEQGK